MNGRDSISRVARRVSLIILSSSLWALSLGPAVQPAGATKYAGEAFSWGVGARVLGLGRAGVARTGDASAIFWNPASLVDPTGIEMVAMHSETFGSLLNHDAVALAWPGNKESGFSLGAMFYYLGGGGISITEFNPETGRGYVVETRGHGDYLLGLALAKRASHLWSWGVTGKLIYRDVAGRSAYGLGLDAGARWQPRDGLSLGIKIADVTGTYLSYNSGTTETIVPHANVGGGLDYQFGNWLISGAAEAETFFENRRGGSQYWVKSISADLHFGLEIGYRGILFGRLGSDIGQLTAGLGTRIWRWNLDVAYLHHRALDGSYRVSLGYRFP